MLVERGGRLIAIETKFAESPDHSALKGIRALKRFYGEALFEKGYIACRTQLPFPLEEDVEAVPGSHIDQYLE
ncbi:MAG TPA: hypothetical protein ENG73_04540 [Desulfobacterales bacterium]|nr:hypothetical protein [Desulfobacterales bacterium]